MAFSSFEKQNNYLTNNTFNSLTENTITSSSALKKEFNKIKKQGYSLDLEEFELGLICIAIPVFNKKGEAIAGVSASGPSSRFKMENVEKYISILQKGVSVIEKSL